jgi:enamine deaminase RidA (YjgF/YER057c/UK114 family)
MTFSESHPMASAVSAGFAGAALALALSRVLKGRGLLSASRVPIQRGTISERGSDFVIHNNTVYVSGQVAVIDTLAKCDVQEQTRQTLAKIDGLLKKAGTDKRHILTSQIWLKDIKTDFADMNVVWNEYVAEFPHLKGTRACVEAEMARPNILVEIKVVAALPAQ